MLEEGVDDGVRERFSTAIEMLQTQGATVVNVALPHAAYAVPTYYVVAPAEASSNLARYDGVRYAYRAPLETDHTDIGSMYDRTRDGGFGDEVKRRIMLGTYALSAGYYDAYYLKAQQVRTLIRRDYDVAFEHVDAVAMPHRTHLGVRNRRTIRRSTSALYGRHLHRECQPNGVARAYRTVRPGRLRASYRITASWACLRRNHATTVGGTLRTGRALVAEKHRLRWPLRQVS